MDATDLAGARTDRASLLTQSADIYRIQGDSANISTGAAGTLKYPAVPCRVSYPGGGQGPVVNTLLRAMTVQKPGAVTIHFADDTDILTKDRAIIEGVRYIVGAVHNENPQRFGTDVDAEMVRAF